MSTTPRLFAYRSQMWQSRTMDPSRCEHTIHHLADDGYLNGSWTTDKTEHGIRVVCESCGKFYGYLSQHSTLPVRHPVPSETGSSFCAEKPARPTTVPTQLLGASRPGPTRRPAIDYAELRRRVGIGQVLQLLEFSPVCRSGSQVRGPCPVHRSQSERSRSFSANLEKNAYQCFAKNCGSKGNQLDLFVAATGLELYHTALEICERLSIPVPWREISQ